MDDAPSFVSPKVRSGAMKIKERALTRSTRSSGTVFMARRKVMQYGRARPFRNVNAPARFCKFQDRSVVLINLTFEKSEVPKTQAAGRPRPKRLTMPFCLASRARFVFCSILGRNTVPCWRMVSTMQFVPRYTVARPPGPASETLSGTPGGLAGGPDTPFEWQKKMASPPDGQRLRLHPDAVTHGLRFEGRGSLLVRTQRPSLSPHSERDPPPGPKPSARKGATGRRTSRRAP